MFIAEMGAVMGAGIHRISAQAPTKLDTQPPNAPTYTQAKCYVENKMS